MEKQLTIVYDVISETEDFDLLGVLLTSQENIN